MFRAIVLSVLIVSTLTACNLRELLLPRIVAGQEQYLGPDRFSGSEFLELADGVYSYRWLHYRNLVLDTEEGWVVVDPLNRQAATELREQLSKLKPAQTIAALIYSHYHLDHASGGEVLRAERIIAHKNSPFYWTDFPGADIEPPTELIEGDTVLQFGTVSLRVLDLGKSHSDTLFAFHLPEANLLFSVDMGLSQAFLPMGHPDSYGPGVMRALEKMAEVDFEVFVPAHFDMGTKDDLLEYIQLQRDIRRLAREALDLYGPADGATLPGDGDALMEMFSYIYEPLKAEYGHYHGFNQQSLYVVFSGLIGETLGF